MENFKRHIVREKIQGEGRTRQNYEKENLNLKPFLAKIFQTENNVTVVMLVERLRIHNQPDHGRKHDISDPLIAFLTPLTGKTSRSVPEYIRAIYDGDLDVVKASDESDKKEKED